MNKEYQRVYQLAAERGDLIKELKFTVKNLREEATMQIASSVKAFDRIKELEAVVKKVSNYEYLQGTISQQELKAVLQLKT